MRGLPRLRASRAFATVLSCASLWACGGGSSATGTPSSPASVVPASEEEWRSLATPRAEPLTGAPRVSVNTMEILGSPTWPTPPGVDPALAVTELMAAGLLRRQDVDFVERRRFVAAADAERRGEARPRGAPRAGTSRGAQFQVSSSWIVQNGQARLDVRLTVPGTSEVVATWRTPTPATVDAVSLARLALGGATAALDSLGVRPVWEDPARSSAPQAYRDAGIPAAAATAFLQGLAAEEAWAWETARAAYQGAVRSGGPAFVEAEAALARTARLRNGGTLGER